MILSKTPGVMKKIHLNEIEDNPYQPRVECNQIELVNLAKNIKDFGLLQIPVARQHGNKFQLAFGHRRKRAFEILSNDGLVEYCLMPLCVASLTDREMFEISISENLQRHDLNPIERATALQSYMDKFKATSAQAAKLFGISPSHVRGLTRLLDLPNDIQSDVKNGKISQSHARRILSKNPRKKYTFHQKSEDTSNLKIKLIKLVYGKYVSGVTDDMLFSAIKRVFDKYSSDDLRQRMERA